MFKDGKYQVKVIICIKVTGTSEKNDSDLKKKEHCCCCCYFYCFVFIYFFTNSLWK